MVVIGLLAAAWAQEPAAVEIVVVAGPAETSASVTVVEVRDAPPGADVASALDAVPGTSVRRLGGLGDWASVSIRGSSARQVEVYLDGIPLNPEGAEVVNLAELPLRAFERVEVYRGSAPPELGGSPIGGVVHLVTGDREGASASVGGGSWGTASLGAAASTPVRDGDVLAIADGFRTRGRFPWFDDRGTPSNPADDRERLRENADHLQGNLHLRLRHGRWTALSAGLARESGIPGFSWLPAREARFRVLQELLAVGWERAGEQARTGFATWISGREERRSDPAAELGFVAGTATVFQASTGARAWGRWIPDPRLAAVGAVELRGAGLRSPSGWFVGRQAGEASAALTLRDRDERVAFTPVLQGTALRDALVATGPAEVTAFVAPRAGLLVGVAPRVALIANGGRYLRPPDLLERFGDQGVLVGNAELRPERGTQGDLGVRLTAPDARFEAIGFAGRATDRIGWLQNAQGLARPENLDVVDTVGAEFATDGALGWAVWSAAFTWTRARQRSELAAWDGQPVAGIPELAWHHRGGVRGGSFELAHTLDAASGTPLDAAGLFVTAPRWLVGLDGRVTRKAVSLEAAVLNLLDRRTETTARDPLVDDGTTAERAVTDYFGYPLPGRTALVTLRVER